MGGSGWGGQGRCELRREVLGRSGPGGGGGRRSEVFVKFQKKNYFFFGGVVRVDVNGEVKFL